MNEHKDTSKYREATSVSLYMVEHFVEAARRSSHQFPSRWSCWRYNDNDNNDKHNKRDADEDNIHQGSWGEPHDLQPPRIFLRTRRYWQRLHSSLSVLKLYDEHTWYSIWFKKEETIRGAIAVFLTLFKGGGGGGKPMLKNYVVNLVCSRGHLTTWNLHEKGLLRHWWWNLRVK